MKYQALVFFKEKITHVERHLLPHMTVLSSQLLILMLSSLTNNYFSNSLFNQSSSGSPLISWNLFLPFWSWNYFLIQKCDSVNFLFMRTQWFWSLDKIKLLMWSTKGSPYPSVCFQHIWPHSSPLSVCCNLGLFPPCVLAMLPPAIGSTNMKFLVPRKLFSSFLIWLDLFLLLILAQLSLPQRLLCLFPSPGPTPCYKHW